MDDDTADPAAPSPDAQGAAVAPSFLSRVLAQPTHTTEGRFIRPEAEIEAAAARRVRDGSLLDHAEKRPLFRWLRLLEPAGVLLAVVAFGLELTARQEARTVAAWQLLTTPAPGNSGKREALEYLNSPEWFGLFGPPRASLQGIDVRSPPAGPSGRRPAGAYLAGVDLRNADLSNARFDEAVLVDANLSGASLTGATFERANLTSADLGDAGLMGASFNHAVATNIRLDGADLEGSDFSDTVFHLGDLRETRLQWLVGAATTPEPIRADRAVFAGMHFTGSELALVGEEILFFWSEVSGARMEVSSSASGAPAGIVWAHKQAPAIALPSSLIYLLCSGDPTPVGLIFWIEDWRELYQTQAGRPEIEPEPGCEVASLAGEAPAQP